jgi:hypothetical protein
MLEQAMPITFLSMILYFQQICASGIEDKCILVHFISTIRKFVSVE